MRIPKQSNSEDYLPPLALLSSAFKSGVMEGLEPDKAIDFLEAFVHNLMNSKAGVEHLPGLCTSKSTIFPYAYLQSSYAS